MKYLYCLPLVLCLACSNISEVEPEKEVLPNTIEGLENLLNTDISDDVRLMVYTKLVKALKDVNANEANKYLDEQLSLATKINNIEYKGRAYHSKGLLLRRRGNFTDAITAYLHAVDLFDDAGDVGRLADDLNNIGYIFLQVEGYDEAIAYFEKASHYYKATEDHTYQIVAYINLALCHTRKKFPDFKLAEEYYLKAINLQESIDPNDNYQLNHAYNLLGWLYFDQGKYQTAIVHYKTSLDYAEKIGSSNQELIINLYYNLAEAYMYWGEEHYTDAEQWIAKASEFDNTVFKDSKVIIERLNIVGQLKQKQNLHSEAIKIFEQAIEIADKSIINKPLQNTFSLLDKSHRAIIRNEGEVDYESIYRLKDLEQVQKTLKDSFNGTLDKPALKQALVKEVEDYHDALKQAELEDGWRMVVRFIVLIMVTLLFMMLMLYFTGKKKNKQLRKSQSVLKAIEQVLRN